jgi:peroxiredoxin
MEARTTGLKLNIGDKAPDFQLPGVDGKVHTLNDYKGKKAIAIVFMCNHCPYVQGSVERLKSIQSEFAMKGLQIVGINSNDEVNYPEDSFDKMVDFAKERHINFTYLRDEDQAVARLYDAQCTPEVFLFDGHRHMKYHGRIDNSPKDQALANVTDFRNAVDAVLHDRKVAIELTPAIGCSIKWR